MIIVKPKTAPFVGQKKSGDFQTFETCPEKGLIFKARTMTKNGEKPTPLGVGWIA